MCNSLTYSPEQPGLPILPFSMLWQESSGGGPSGRAASSCPDNPSSVPLGPGLYSISINQWRILNQVRCRDAMLTDFPKNRLSLRRSKLVISKWAKIKKNVVANR